MRTALKFREKKRDSSSLVNVLHKSCNYAFSRTVKKFTKKRDARAKSLFFSITYCFFDVLVAVAVVVAKAPYYPGAPNENIVQNHFNIALLNAF